MIQKKKKKIKSKRRPELLDIKINDAVKVVLDISEFRKQVKYRLAQFIIGENDKFSLTQCAEICDVDAPQLGYYVQQGIVKPIGKVERGFKKYFSHDALLAFFIIKSLKQSMRINIDCLTTLQKSVK